MASVKVQERRLTGEIVAKSIATTGRDDQLMRLSVVATTDAPVLRHDFVRGEDFLEVLDVTSESVNTTRLDKGLPVLDSHQRNSLSNILGKTTSYRFENGQLLLDLKISSRPELEDFRQDVRDGIIANVSIGYSINTFKDEGKPKDDKEGLRTLRATDWEPLEVSLVAVPADSDATVTDARTLNIPLTNQPEHNPMPDNHTDKTKGVDVDALVNEQVKVQLAIEKKKLEESHAAKVKAEKEAVAQLKLRDNEIRANVKRLSLSDEFADGLVADESIDIHQARQKCIEAVAKVESKSHVASMPGDHNEKDNFLKGMQEALSIKVKQDQVRSFNVDKEMTERAKPFFNASNGFFDNLIREHMVNVENIDRDEVRNLDKSAVVNHMLGTRAFGGIAPSDLPYTLSNVLDKVLRQLYTLTPKTYLELVKATTLNNFKIHPRIQNEPSTGLYKLDESLTPVGGATSSGTIREDQQTIQLQTYTKDLFITRQALIDDDLGAFSRIPAVAASDIIYTESALVYGLINSNTATFTDNTVLFTSGHNNLNTSNALGNDDAISVAKTAMRKQTNLAGLPILNEPNILLVPIELELAALKFVTILTQLNTSSEIAQTVQSLNLTLIQSPFLSADQGGSDTTWYLINNSQPDMLIELATLDNKSGINASFFAEVEIGVGIKYKVLHDAAVALIDYRPYSQNTA